jgi:hypothetical protein
MHLNLSEVTFSPSAVPGISRLTALTSLELCHGHLAPVALRSCTQLQSLTISFMKVAGDDANGSLLLSELEHLQQLQQLHLLIEDCAWPPLGAAYAAITASSKLQCLHIEDGDELCGAWQYMCPEGRSLPALRKFTLSPSPLLNPAPPPAMSQADVSRLVRCCPGVVDAVVTVSQGVQLGQLGQLSSLTKLAVEGAGASGSLPSLSAVTGLRHLSAMDTHYPQQSQLLPLTALRQLTALLCSCVSAAPSDADQPSAFVQQVRAMQRW